MHGLVLMTPTTCAMAPASNNSPHCIEYASIVSRYAFFFAPSSADSLDRACHFCSTNGDIAFSRPLPFALGPWMTHTCFAPKKKGPYLTCPPAWCASAYARGLFAVGCLHYKAVPSARSVCAARCPGLITYSASASDPDPFTEGESLNFGD